MQSQDGRPDTQLNPAGIKLIILFPEKVPADVVGPESEPDITRRSGEFGLEVEGLPGDDGIPAETDGVAMTTRSSVSGETQRSFTVKGRVEVMVVVQNPKGLCQSQTLLPVDPLCAA